MNSLYPRIEALDPSKRALLVQRLKRHLAASAAEAGSTKRLVGYIVSDGMAPSAGDLRAFLKETLPDYMVPARFVVLDNLPLMPNGKVDYKSLPDPDQTRTDIADDSFAAPTNDIERKLAEIWTAVLGIDVVSVHDNFFEVGGDSILSIQIIARAKQAGIHITPKQVFQHLTIAELARVAQSGASPQADQATVTGELPLTPIQHWFFERQLPNPNHWNQAYLLDVPRDLDKTYFDEALGHLLRHHDVLRSRFRYINGTWRQTIASAATTVRVQPHDLSHLDRQAQIAAMEAMAAALQANLDIGAGPLLAAALFECGAHNGNRLCLAIHHLVVDAVSWQILLEDLETAYVQLTRGQAVQLPAKTTSFKTWAERLVEYARSDAPRHEQRYWLQEAASKNVQIPVDFPGGINIEASERRVIVELDGDETASLLKEAPAAYNTRIDDLLLTAMTMTCARWVAADAFSLDMEGHGREDIIDGIDLSRTVGWFTSFYPLTLELPTREPGAAIKSIKEQLRRIPHRGIGFGVSCYLSDDDATRDKFHHVPRSPVLYNYLGQFGRSNAVRALFKPTTESAGPSHDLKGLRSHVLEIDAMVIDDRLRVEWVYSENLHERTTIETLANDYMSNLRTLIAHCRSPETGGFSPSDFPEAKLDQAQLDELLNQLGEP